MITVANFIKIEKNNLEKIVKLLGYWQVFDLEITEFFDWHLISFSVFDWQRHKIDAFPKILDTYDGILMDIPMIFEEE